MDPSLGMQQAAKGWKVGYGPSLMTRSWEKCGKLQGKKKGRWP